MGGGKITPYSGHLRSLLFSQIQKIKGFTLKNVPRFSSRVADQYQSFIHNLVYANAGLAVDQKLPKILQNDLNCAVSMTTKPFIYHRYHFLISPPLRDNIIFLSIISKGFLFWFDRFFTNLHDGVPDLNFCFLRMCQNCTKHNDSMGSLHISPLN